MVVESKLAEKLENIPIGLYFILIIGSMCYITMYPLGLPIPVTKWTRDTYDVVENLNPGDILLIDNAYGAGTLAVHEPGFIVIFKHAMSKGAKIVILSTAVEGTLLLDRAIDKIDPASKGYEYGKDWVHLGYVSGGEAAAAAVLADARATFSVDYKGNPLDQMEIFDELSAPTYTKISAVFVQTAGTDTCQYWIRQASVRYGIPMIQQPLGMMVPPILPYYPVNLQGILNGGLGAAEYEVYAKLPGEAVKLSDMLTVAGLVVFIFLVLGNIGDIIKRRGVR